MDEMKAGRELDALVAEKVMGWADELCPGCINQDAVDEWISCVDDWRLVCNYCGWEKTRDRRSFGTDVEHRGLIPRYSTKITDAWEVVGKLRTLSIETQERFINALVVMRDKWSNENDQSISEWLMFNVLRWLLFKCQDIPLAICLAALEALKG